MFALNLLLVPALAWLVGRAMGRRDMRIGSVIAAGCMVTVLAHAARLAVLAGLGTQSFADEYLRVLTKSLEAPEVGLFLLAFGVFLAMLGWTATPIFVAKT